MLCRFQEFLDSSLMELELEVFSNFWNCLLDVVVISCPGCCVHMCIVASFWTLCQLWISELSWEGFPNSCNDIACSATRTRLITCEVLEVCNFQDILEPLEG